MNLNRRLILSCVVGVVLGLAIIISPTFLWPTEFGYQGPTVTPTVAPTPTPKGPVPPPFTFEFDINESYGFEKTYLAYETYGTPVFVVSRGKSATVAVVVTSLSNKTLQICLAGIRGLPPGVEAKLDPEAFILHAYERATLRLIINVSATAPISTLKPTPTPTFNATTPPPTPTPTPPELPPTVTPPEALIPADFIELILRGDDYGIGTGFLLTII